MKEVYGYHLRPRAKFQREFGKMTFGPSVAYRPYNRYTLLKSR